MPLSAFTSERILDTCFTGEKNQYSTSISDKAGSQVTTTESFFNYCFVVFGVIQKINILDSSQSGVKNGADSEAVLAALIEHLELINPSGRLSQNTRSAMLQLREEEWSEFFLVAKFSGVSGLCDY